MFQTWLRAVVKQKHATFQILPLLTVLAPAGRLRRIGEKSEKN